jgi:hypothetical protein
MTKEQVAEHVYPLLSFELDPAGSNCPLPYSRPQRDGSPLVTYDLFGLLIQLVSLVFVHGGVSTSNKRLHLFFVEGEGIVLPARGKQGFEN